MRKSIVVLGLLTQAAFAGQLVIPTIKEMWNAADVVVTAEGWDVEDNVYQGDLPEHPILRYKRVNIFFNDCEVLKGELRPANKETNTPAEIVWVTTLIAEEKSEDEVDQSVKVLEPFGPPPYISAPPADRMLSFLVFMRRDVFGDLEPVHPSYFMYYTIIP